MISRLAEKLIHELAEQFPVVLILGPRQCGKTTLAKHFLDGEYFDLERPADQDIFLDDIEFALNQFKHPLILDEAQTLPELFPVLRSLVDPNRQLNGRYFLLGSVNPSRIRQISESLAGRVGIVELTPFLFPELPSKTTDLTALWLKGGYPDAFNAANASHWQRWQENYARTLIERDIPAHGGKLSAIQIRRLMGMIANLHGGLLNASDLGRSLGISYHTVNTYLDLMEGHFLIRRLPPYHPNIKKRIVKSPKLYIRDTGVLHYLLGISKNRDLLSSPKRGSSWEGLLIEHILALEGLTQPGGQSFFFRTHAGAEVDLIIDRGHETVGFEFKCAVSVSRKDWHNLAACIQDGVITKGMVVYMGTRNYDAAHKIRVVNAEKLLIHLLNG